MSTQSSTIVQRVWNDCSVLRDDGISYGDYVEQLTYLIFLKMDEENAPLGRPNAIPISPDPTEPAKTEPHQPHPQRSTLNVQRSTFNTRPPTFDLRPSTSLPLPKRLVPPPPHSPDARTG